MITNSMEDQIIIAVKNKIVELATHMGFGNNPGGLAGSKSWTALEDEWLSGTYPGGVATERPVTDWQWNVDTDTLTNTFDIDTGEGPDGGHLGEYGFFSTKTIGSGTLLFRVGFTSPARISHTPTPPFTSKYRIETTLKLSVNEGG